MLALAYVHVYVYIFFMKLRDLKNALKELGFSLLREGGNHEVWSNSVKTIAVPRHSEINEITAKSIIKQAGGGKKK